MERHQKLNGTNTNMEEYQIRVVDEQHALEDKAHLLYSFLASKKFNELDNTNQQLLKQQYYAMMVYSGILQQRIDRF